MLRFTGMCQEEKPPQIYGRPGGFCEERKRLLDRFLEAIHELNELQSQQVQAVIDGDSDFNRFDLLLHMAQEKKESAKYDWIAHVELHCCE